MILFLIVTLFINCNDKELFEDYYKEAEKYMSHMTLEQKIGQIFFPRYNDETKEKIINTTYLGGFVLYGNDFKNKNEQSVIKNIEYIQNLSMNSINLPLGLAVDEEGGDVSRISRYFREKGDFPSPQEIYNESGIEGILTIDKEKRDLLRKFKMNINLAPVADISYNSSDYIYDRTLGRLPEETAKYIKDDVEGYVKDHFTCCLKHFPGYGNNINTHYDVAYDYRPYEQFQKEDFETFKAGISVNVPMILVSHNIVLCKDEHFPASISKTWHDILRNELKFSGLILTDDLSMDAIKKYSGDESPAVLAFNVGNDIILTSDLEEHLNAVIKAAKNGIISIDTINKACKRVIAWKIKYILNSNENKGNDGDNKDNTILIICLVVGGLLLIGIILYCISKKCLCKNSKDDNINDEMGSSIVDSF